MTNPHPLTDEMCETLSRHGLLGCDDDPEGLIYDMRAAYDKGAADTLERVIKWLNVAIYEKSIDCYIDIASLPEELAEAMRPQEGNND